MTFLHQQVQYLVDFGPALLVSLALGTLVGWERYRHHRAPNVSVFIVLCVASALAVRTQLVLAHGIAPTDWALPAAVLTAVGFCGGAFIIWREHGIEGVTTGMTVFFTSVVGIAIGLGLYLPAVVGSMLTLAAMALSNKFWPGAGDSIDSEGHSANHDRRPLPLRRGK